MVEFRMVLCYWRVPWMKTIKLLKSR
jgi:hypothetical protein